MKVLVACESSAVVRTAFEGLGVNAISCDLLPSEIPGNHYQGDVRDILYDGYDAIIAHPPCTRLCNSGVRWLHERDLWNELDEACDFFKLFLDVDCECVVIENPIPHKYAIQRIGVKYDQTQYPKNHTTSDHAAK